MICYLKSRNVYASILSNVCKIGKNLRFIILPLLLKDSFVRHYICKTIQDLIWPQHCYQKGPLRSV